MSEFEYFPRDSKKIREIIIRQRQKDQIEKSVTLFAEEMKKKLLENIDKLGWENESYSYFLGRLHEEIEELEEFIYKNEKKDKVKLIKECADIANFAMMIADKARKEE